MENRMNPNNEIPIETISPTRTYKKTLPCLSFYMAINYKEDGKIDYIKIFGGRKDNDCGGSFLESMADMLTFSIRRIRNEHEAKAIVKNLRFHKCNRCVANREHITSCVDAIGQVLEKELLHV